MRAAAPWLVLLPLLTAVSLVPAIDLGVSALFYRGHGVFSARGTPVGDFVRTLVPRLILAGVAISIALWIFGRWRGAVFAGLDGLRVTYLLSTLVIGPGLVVNAWLKSYSGRARPDEIVPFGGSAEYTPPLWIADACSRNCSFVSGHAAIAYWVTAYAFIAPKAWRSRIMAAALVFGSAVAAVRVMQGAHFVSDVLFAGAIVVGINVLAARLVLRPEA